jgi:hypothetical protein
MSGRGELVCKNARRRRKVREAKRNGLDYVELDSADPTGRTLMVYFLGHLPKGLRPANLRIEGGQRVRPIQILRIDPSAGLRKDQDDVLRVLVDRTGDLSQYTLRVFATDEQGREIGAYREFDPRYSTVDFSFKPGCPSDLDCGTADPCVDRRLPAPEINYLAKDYGTFRQLLLDRLSVLLPEWREGHVPDLGIALVELLAYSGDYLSLYQDAAGTEAYLDTARQRISLRRHAVLVDYRVSEGTNARTWMVLETDTDFELKLADTSFVTRPDPSLDPAWSHRWTELEGIERSRYVTFEALRPGPEETARIRRGLSRIRIYTWGDGECCLPRGATGATLLNEWERPEGERPVPSREGDPQGGTHDQPRILARAAEQPERPLDELRAGDILIFEEVLGPTTGKPEDADRSHRWAVRLTEVGHDTVDSLVPGDPCSEDGCHLVHVSWMKEDALPFPLCVSARRGPPWCDELSDVSVARGNVILVDHGTTGEEPVEPPAPDIEPQPTCDPCEDVAPEPAAPAYWPILGGAPLTWRAELDARVPASTMLLQDAASALPAVVLRSQTGDCWRPVLDLLASGAGQRHFVVETDNDGRAHLRFGDGDLGLRPPGGAKFVARRRLGNGPRGNVGAETIRLLVLRDTLLSGITISVRNPFPAMGGTAPESLDHVRLFAPGAFRKDRRRAVIAEDYAELVKRDFAKLVQGAAARLRWNGSWYEVEVGVDQLGRVEAEPDLLKRVRRRLHRYRRIGHDLRVGAARTVPIAITLHVCVSPHVLRSDVRKALLDAFSNRRMEDGGLGFFNPDSLRYGEGVFLSALVARASKIAGVTDVVVNRLEPLSQPSVDPLETGVLSLGAMEIARLDNDPKYPEFGQLAITVGGGR